VYKKSTIYIAKKDKNSKKEQTEKEKTVTKENLKATQNGCAAISRRQMF